MGGWVGGARELKGFYRKISQHTDSCLPTLFTDVTTDRFALNLADSKMIGTLLLHASSIFLAVARR